MKEAIHDLKYYTSQHSNDPKGKINFWTSEPNRAQYLLPVIKGFLEQPLTDESIKQLGAAALIFRVNSKDSAFAKWTHFFYAIGNSLFLTNALAVPVKEWAELAEQGRKILLKMANGDLSSELENELNVYLNRTYIRKEQLLDHPEYGEFIRSREGMGGL